MKAGSLSNGAIADRMRWLSARTRVLAENVANADTPRFVPRDLAGPDARPAMPLGATNSSHIGGGGQAANSQRPAARLETRPSGNAVSLEDEMLKLSETQLEYQMLAGLYQRGLTMLKTAIGRRS